LDPPAHRNIVLQNAHRVFAPQRPLNASFIPLNSPKRPATNCPHCCKTVSHIRPGSGHE
jgi:hypothetical protein